ncbi:hypothetical protein SAMN04488029_1197 [Reichenbachiella faecimaris]|uniref:Uncharacterized protein n=1 Tax=Reichenbachiella faecimaris TaxID=692418 RepID=A0A1W2G826_REIFA|nr:hypothetical protein SAMN04488029_1197 [Reichenbachiella faecimaris]
MLIIELWEKFFKILIDRDFSDWDAVLVLAERNSDNTGVVSMVKAASDLAYIYFYVEGDMPCMDLHKCI